MTAPPASWQALLAPLPADARPWRAPVDERGHASTLAGWENVVLELSAGADGMRVVHATTDERGVLRSGSDMVMRRVAAAGGGVVWEHESLGGRFEDDGTFHGTRWHGTGPDDPDAEGPPPDPAAANADEGAELRALLVEVLRRAPGR